MLNIILTLFVIPLFLAAFFEFRRNRGAIALLCLVCALALPLKIAFDFRRTQDACTSGAELYAGDIHDSQEAIDCRKSVGGRIVIVHLGPSLFVVQGFFKHVTVLELHGHPVLTLDRTKRGVLITSDLFDRHGNLLATVRRNKVDFSGRSLSCERPDLSALSVTTARGQGLLCTIAPVLAATVKAWLPTVTAARYLDVAVDPEDLSVRVKDVTGEWRNAALLSRGTSEQIFLLLRMAMAARLTRPGEGCPLLLDDVTVQFDNVRTEALLDVLHAISKERQVILFTQEDYVLAWAKRNLQAAIDCLRTLDMPIPDGATHAVRPELVRD